MFNYLYKVVSFNHNTAIQTLEQCKAEQHSQILTKTNELKDLTNDLYSLNSELSQLNKVEDKDINMHMEKLKKISIKIENFFNYEAKLSLLAMNIGIKDDSRNKLFSMIQESYNIDVEFANINGNIPTLKDILQKEKYWVCICGELVNSIFYLREIQIMKLSVYLVVVTEE